MAKLAEEEKIRRARSTSGEPCCDSRPQTSKHARRSTRLYRQTSSWNALTDQLRQDLERLPQEAMAARLSVLRDMSAVYREQLKSDSALVTVLTQIVQLARPISPAFGSSCACTSRSSAGEISWRCRRTRPSSNQIQRTRSRCGGRLPADGRISSRTCKTRSTPTKDFVVSIPTMPKPSASSRSFTRNGAPTGLSSTCSRVRPSRRRRGRASRAVVRDGQDCGRETGFRQPSDHAV